jgi:hypothetical protein
MRAIRRKDFCKVAAVCCGCLAFLAVVIAMEWDHAEFRSKIIVVSLFMAFAILAIRAMVIYRPQQIDVLSLQITRGPYWSATILGVRFVWVEIERDGARRRIRLVA